MTKTGSEIRIKIHAAAAAKSFLGLHCCETKVTALLKQEQCLLVFKKCHWVLNLSSCLKNESSQWFLRLTASVAWGRMRPVIHPMVSQHLFLHGLQQELRAWRLSGFWKFHKLWSKWSTVQRPSHIAKIQWGGRAAAYELLWAQETSPYRYCSCILCSYPIGLEILMCQVFPGTG